MCAIIQNLYKLINRYCLDPTYSATSRQFGLLSVQFWNIKSFLVSLLWLSKGCIVQIKRLRFFLSRPRTLSLQKGKEVPSKRQSCSYSSCNYDWPVAGYEQPKKPINCGCGQSLVACLLPVDCGWMKPSSANAANLSSSEWFVLNQVAEHISWSTTRLHCCTACTAQMGLSLRQCLASWHAFAVCPGYIYLNDNNVMHTCITHIYVRCAGHVLVMRM